MTDLSSYGALDARCDTRLLGRLGHELALVYHDTLQAPLPPGLQRLVERFEAASRQPAVERRKNLSER